MAYAVTTADIEDRWRPLTDEESAVAAVLLTDAGVLLDAQFPALAAAVTANTVPAALVTQVIVGMVKRVLTNPDALRSLSVGNFSESYAETPDLQPSAAELALVGAALAPAVAVAGGGAAYSVSLWG